MKSQGVCLRLAWEERGGERERETKGALRSEDFNAQLKGSRKCVCHFPVEKVRGIGFGKNRHHDGGGRGATLWNSTTAIDCATLFRI